MAAPLKKQLEKQRRELEDSWNSLGNISPWFSWPVPILMLVSCCPSLKLPPLYHTACLLLLIKSLTSCTSRDINLSKTVQRTAVRAPTRMQESEDLAPYSIPCQQEAANRSIPHPQPLSSSLLN
jgi:hypothetical protein